MTGGGTRCCCASPRVAARACAAWRRPSPSVEVDAREVDRPGGGEELDSPYVHEETLDLAAWAHDAFALACPRRSSAARLRRACARSARPTSTSAGPGHHHEQAPDPRWAKLRELKLGVSGRAARSPRPCCYPSHADGRPQEKAVAQPHRQAARAAQDRHARR